MERGRYIVLVFLAMVLGVALGRLFLPAYTVVVDDRPLVVQAVSRVTDDDDIECPPSFMARGGEVRAEFRVMAATKELDKYIQAHDRFKYKYGLCEWLEQMTVLVNE